MIHFNEINKEITLDGSTVRWIDGEFHAWGETKTPEGVSCTCRRFFTPRGRLREEYVFTNTTDSLIGINEGDLGIWTPFNDSYASSGICEKYNCHAHIWCGGTSSFVNCLAMSGKAPHLGLVLTSGNISSYLCERRETSDDRGDIMLLSAPFILIPGAEAVISWEIFEHSYDDFFSVLEEYENYVPIHSPFFTFFENEKPEILIKNEKRELQNSLGYFKENENGALYAYQVLPEFDLLVKKRCEFIKAHQQETEGKLKGAYTVFDNETGQRIFEEMPRPNRNAGRERAGMSVLMAKYLQKHFDSELFSSLKMNIDFILRAYFNPETGEVFNMFPRDNSRRRIYNNAWYATLFREMYKLTKDKTYLEYMCGAFYDLYSHGGENFYPLNIEMCDSIKCLEKENMLCAKERLFNHFKKNADFILKNGTAYPPYEVSFEDNIVTPAGDICAQMYELTGEEKYLAAAREHLEIHKIFLFFQPDARMHGVSIHHWDDFWFGKRELYGDTYPHYWSSAGSLFYARMSKYESVEKDKFLRIARAGIRSCLGCFFHDGSATCAIVTPYSVNGKKGQFIDPWANDQDWALYHAILFDEEFGI